MVRYRQGGLKACTHQDKSIDKKLSATVDQLLSNQAAQRFEDMLAAKAALEGGSSSRFLMPSLPWTGLGIAAAVLLLLLGLGGLAGSGGLGEMWEAIQPVDKVELARQKASVAKLQGEIKTYKQRLESARRQLDSDIREALRNDDSSAKYLEHWQTITDNYLFEGDQITEFEGELSKGELLLREDSIPEAQLTMTGVRDGYKNLWDQFSAAEVLFAAEENTETAYKHWLERKRAYDLADPGPANKAVVSEDDAKESQRAGDFVSALNSCKSAEQSWKAAYSNASGQVAQIKQDRAQRARDKLAAEKAERERRAAAEKVARDSREAAEAERKRIAAKQEREELAHKRMMAEIEKIKTPLEARIFLTKNPLDKYAALVKNKDYYLQTRKVYKTSKGYISDETYEYDSRGNKIRTLRVYSNPHGRGLKKEEKRYSYDGMGNLTKSEEYNSTGKLTSRWVTRYDNQGRIISSKRDYPADSQFETSYHYNSQGNLLKKNSTDRRYTYQYNSSNKLIKETEASYTNTGNNEHTTYDYHENGNLRSSKNTTTVSTNTQTYDPNHEGRIIESLYVSQSSGPTRHKYQYNSLGQKIAVETSGSYQRTGQL